MSKVTVRLDKIKITEGQGVTEGDFELRVTVSEGTHSLSWPSANGTANVEKDVDRNIGQEVASYTVNSGTLSKKFNISLLEADKGPFDQDDEGAGSITMDLTPNMSPVTKSTTVSLKRPDAGFQGKVLVTLAASAA
jgi:hypothetical protein